MWKSKKSVAALSPCGQDTMYDLVFESLVCCDPQNNELFHGDFIPPGTDTSSEFNDSVYLILILLLGSLFGEKSCRSCLKAKMFPVPPIRWQEEKQHSRINECILHRAICQ